MNNTEENQMVSTAQIHEGYIKLLNAAAKRQVTDDKYWWDRLPVPKTLKFRLPRPECITEVQALEFWRANLTEKTQAQIDVELV